MSERVADEPSHLNLLPVDIGTAGLGDAPRVARSLTADPISVRIESVRIAGTDTH